MPLFDDAVNRVANHVLTRPEGPSILCDFDQCFKRRRLETQFVRKPLPTTCEFVDGGCPFDSLQRYLSEAVSSLSQDCRVEKLALREGCEGGCDDLQPSRDFDPNELGDTGSPGDCYRSSSHCLVNDRD